MCIGREIWWCDWSRSTVDGGCERNVCFGFGFVLSNVIESIACNHHFYTLCTICICFFLCASWWRGVCLKLNFMNEFHSLHVFCFVRALRWTTERQIQLKWLTSAINSKYAAQIHSFQLNVCMDIAIIAIRVHLNWNIYHISDVSENNDWWTIMIDWKLSSYGWIVEHQHQQLQQNAVSPYIFNYRFNFTRVGKEKIKSNNKKNEKNNNEMLFVGCSYPTDYIIFVTRCVILSIHMNKFCGYSTPVYWMVCMTFFIVVLSLSLPLSMFDVVLLFFILFYSLSSSSFSSSSCSLSCFIKCYYIHLRMLHAIWTCWWVTEQQE